MRVFLAKATLCGAFICILACRESKMELADFSSDGCSLFINGTFDNPEYGRSAALCMI